MSDQQVMPFPNREQHPSVRVHDPDTCVEPAEERLSPGREMALRCHAEHASGLTDFELAEHTGKAQTSIGKRRKDLEVRGLVVATTERRPSPQGAPATVYRITEMGSEFARGLSDSAVSS